ncbi:hypothetical protein KXD40_002648 [Peronospora effusa]|uniref:Uncharacterized protein n=1 Tax=Peronospora effusa TaxID=542832 RepID=A0A3M6VD31_9STRA|nr:hypothetical protein DD238_005541 [Peronospora effusa]RQM15231.1 hypothetical protein DD237_005463 [Peronospora effusa]UIZ26454.1 hypothetical protein KXD40_002648 [Peronospora effusa]CAI5702215.1 unnamed protein product [Peronospora effusa]
MARPHVEPPALGADDINVSFPMPRPISVFQLSGVSSTGSGRFVLPDLALRKVIKKPIFENFDESAYNVKPPTQMLRFIDGLRYHKPTSKESEALNLSSATERIYLHVLNDILMMCGARKGARFSSLDVNRLRAIADQLGSRYEAVDETFRTLSTDVMRYRFQGVTRLEDDPSHFEFLANRRRNSLVGMDLLNLEDQVRRKAFHFQWLARQYVVTFAQLKTAMQEICDRVQKDMAVLGALSAPTLADINDAVEAEFESKTHRPFPTFLFVLIQKYHREQRNKSTAWTIHSDEPPVDSIGHFVLYLSSVLLQPAPMTAAELHSVQVLLQIVKAEFRIDYHSMILVVTKVVQADGQVIVNTLSRSWPDSVTTGVEHSCRHASDVRVLTHKTMGSLLFAFLTTVRELRLVPRKKELLNRGKKMKET